MGLRFDHEAIRNVRSGKGVLSGLDVTRTGANQLTVGTGRARMGIDAARYTALGEQYLNEGGAELTLTVAVTFDSTALADGTYSLYLLTGGTASNTAEAAVVLTDGPLMNVNMPGLTVSPNTMDLGSPSVKLCSFTKAAGAIAGNTSISYVGRESLV
jgi:hypothetical protein